jgi:hypothetical protein
MAKPVSGKHQPPAAWRQLLAASAAWQHGGWLGKSQRGSKALENESLPSIAHGAGESSAKAAAISAAWQRRSAGANRRMKINV